MKKIILLNDTEKWYHFGCTGTSIALKNELSKRGEIIKSYPINNYDFKDYCENLKDTDWVVINGEGSIHSVNHHLLDAALVAKVAGKKVAIINASIYPARMNEEHYQRVLNRCDFVGVRETLSGVALTRLAIRCTQTFDCLPLYIKNTHLFRSPATDLIGIAGSVTYREYLKKPDEREVLAKLIDGLSPTEICFLYGGLDYIADEDKMCDHILKTNGIRTIHVNTLNDFLSSIASFKKFVSGRFHHSIAAYCLGIPIEIKESNTPKNKAIREMFAEKPTLNQLCEMAMHNFDFI